jgi:hypothetical protein
MSREISIEDEFRNYIDCMDLEEINRQVPDVFTSETIWDLIRDSKYFDDWFAQFKNDRAEAELKTTSLLNERTDPDGEGVND